MYDDDKVEELRASLLEFEEMDVLQALILNNIIDQDTGQLTDYWLNLVNLGIPKVPKVIVSNEEEIVLSALAKLLQRHLK